MKAIEKPIDFNERIFSQRAHQIYNRIKSDLEQNYKGKILAVEPESGDYFIGESKMEAAMQAKVKHPDKFFYFFRIGFEAMYKRSITAQVDDQNTVDVFQIARIDRTDIF